MSFIISDDGKKDLDEPHAKITFIEPEVAPDGFRVFNCGDQSFQVSADGTFISDESGCELKQSDLVLIASAAVSALNYAVETAGLDEEIE